MKNCLLLLLLSSSLLHAQTVPSPIHKDPQKYRFRFSVLSGYQQENFSWSIAGNSSGTNPNIYSELIWKNLSGPLAGAELEFNIWRSFWIRSSISRLFIVSGKVTDMDYQGDNRTNRSYYGAFDSDKGNSFSWRTTLEYKIPLTASISLSPAIGYVYHIQSLYLLSDNAGLGNNKLRSTYATNYEGATIGARAAFILTKKFSLEPSLYYDQIKYHGKADWNLITTFEHPLSFEDIANGYDIKTGIKANYSWKDYCSFFLAGNYFYSNTGTGTDRLYQTNGQQPLTQFNGATRHFWAIKAGISLSLP